jgi:TP901 family phage tail tape measure protein
MVDKLNGLNKKLVDNQYQQRDCNKVISEAKKKLKEIKDQIGDNRQATEDEEKQIAALTRTIEEEKLKLSQLRTEQASIRNLISETTHTLTENNEQWTVLKGTLANLASDTLQKLASGLKNVVSDVIRTGEEFTAAISKVGAISGATADELKQLEDAARLYGSTTMFSAKESADALQYMALAGWNAQQAIDALPSVLSLAASSGMDLGRASDIVTDYITAFGLSVDDAARFVDIMSYAMSHSNTTTEMLGEAYKNCAATAHSMGITVEEVTAALMTMANAGVKGGEAGTTLNTLMTRLATNTKGCADELKEYGVAIYDAQGNMNSLSDILSGMIGAWSRLTQEQQANLSKVIAGTNQYSGFQTIMQGMSDKAKAAGMSFEDYTKALEDCNGTASQMSKTMTDNLTGDIKSMQSALDELKLKIFEDAEQPLRNIVQWITKSGIPALEALVKNIDKIIPVVVAATAAMVSYKAALAVQSIIKGVQSGLAALKAARVADTVATEAETAAQNALNTAQAANPIGLLVGLIGGLAAGIASLAMVTNGAASAFKNYNEALDELLKKQSEAEANAVAEGKKVELLKEEYDRLREKTDLTTREKERFAAVCEQLAGKLGITTEELKTQAGAYRDLTQEVSNYLEKLKEQAKYDYYSDIITESAKAAAQIEADLEVAEKARQAFLDGNMKAYREYIQILKDQGHNVGVGGFIEMEALINQLNQQLDKSREAADRAAEAYKRLGQTGELTGSILLGLKAAFAGITGSTEDYKKAIEDAEKKLEELAKEEKNLQSQSSSLRSEMNSLANSLKQLENGETLSLNTLLDLISKYPEYAAELIKARDNADLQRKALELLFEAKKQEYILSLERAAKVSNASNEETAIVLENLANQIEAYNKLGTTMGNVALAAVVANSVVVAALRSQAQDLRNTVKNYQDEINFVKNLSIGDFASGSGSGSGSSGGSSGSSNKKTINYTREHAGETYTTSYSYDEGKYNVTDAVDAQAKAYLGVWERAKSFGKMTLSEEIGALQSLLKWEQLSADQRYDIRLRLYKAQQELAKKNADAEKEASEAAQKAAEEANKALLDRQNLALAAYNKLVNGKIDALKAESKAAQDSADKQIAALDAVMKKRNEEKEDAKRQQELNAINAKLSYQQMDNFTRHELERRRQDILNEQYEVDYSRNIEAQKAAINAGAVAVQDRNAAAIAGLQASQTQAADRIAYVQGNQSYDQRVASNSKTYNIQIMRNGFTDEQLVQLANKMIKELG